MKKVMFALACIGGLASCTQDATCTCTTGEYSTLGVTVEAVTTVTECLGCTSDEISDFEAACTAADDALQLAGAGIPGYSASCTLD